MPFEDLASLTEGELAMLLGVNQCTVRRWHKSNGLPSHGYRQTKRFDWPEVLEWHLKYRARIALAGGAQLGTLTSEMREMRREVSEAAKASVTSKFREHIDEMRRDHSAEISRLRTELEELRPRRRRRYR